MKKYITSALSSALIIPGLGQIINGQIKKGLILMGVVFVIIIGWVIKLTQLIVELLPGLRPDELNLKGIQDSIDIRDVSVLKIMIFVFLIVWIYSIIDAFINGIKVEKGK